MIVTEETLNGWRSNVFVIETEEVKKVNYSRFQSLANQSMPIVRHVPLS